VKFKTGDHVFYWLYYKHPGLHGMKRKEALGKIMDATSHVGYVLWCYFDRERRWVGPETIIREASPLEVFNYQVSLP